MPLPSPELLQSTATPGLNPADATASLTDATARLRSLLGDCARLQRSRQPSACLAAAQQVLCEAPGCPQALAYAGWAQFQLRQPSDAAAALGQALCSPDAQDWSERERFNMHTLLQACSVILAAMQASEGQATTDSVDGHASEATPPAATAATASCIDPPESRTAKFSTAAAGAAAAPQLDQSASGSPGDLLRRGWYARHLTKLLQEGRLAPAGG